jgi:hypothetical protein
MVGPARTRCCGGVLQHVPYVKTMFRAVMALKGACSQAVHNKERCAALAECVRVAFCIRATRGLAEGVWDGLRAGAGPSMRARAMVGACVCAPVGIGIVIMACLPWSVSHTQRRGGAAGGSKGSARC